MKFINSFTFAVFSAGMLVVVQNFQSFAFEFVLLFILASLVQLGAKEAHWLAFLVALPQAVANLDKKRKQRAEESATKDYPELAIALAFEQETQVVIDEPVNEAKVGAETVEGNELGHDLWQEEPALSEDSEIESTPQLEIFTAEESPALDAKVSEIKGVDVPVVKEEPAVLETTPVVEESALEPSDGEEILDNKEILENLKGLGTAKAWHRVFDELKGRGYNLSVQDRKASSQQARANFLSRYNVRKRDMDVAREVALQFLQSQKTGSHKAAG